MGPCSRPGTLYPQAPVQTVEHDLPSLAEGVVIPHGLDALKQHQG